jgi:hypothetical protein
MRRDHTIALFGVSLLLVLFSYFLFAFGVHSYCENRPVMLGIASGAGAAVYFLAVRWPAPAWRRGMAVFAILLFLSVVGFNSWYFVWTTRTCNQQLQTR